MRVVLRQADLDTCVAGLVLGVSATDDVFVVPALADPEDLADPLVVCLECGGSGQTHLLNFDHHEARGPIDPACRQAATYCRTNDPELLRLVRYAESVDLGTSARPDAQTASRSVSALVSGIRLTEADAVSQLHAVLRVLTHAVGMHLDPIGPLPVRQEWEAYFLARQGVRPILQQAADCARLFRTKGEQLAGFIETDAVGALGALYARGCAVGIALNNRYRVSSLLPPTRKFTVGCIEGQHLEELLKALSVLEDGWGGPSHGRVIGSPLGRGSDLAEETIVQLVQQLM